LVLSRSTMSEEQHLSTRLLHADDEYCDTHVAPYISVSTSEFISRASPQNRDLTPYSRFPLSSPRRKYINPEDEIDFFSPSRHIYSRYTQANSTRVEKVLGDLHVSSPSASYRLSSPECIRLEWVRLGIFFRACCNLRSTYLPPGGGRRSEPDTSGRHWCTSGPSVSPSVTGTMEFTKRFKSTAK